MLKISYTPIVDTIQIPFNIKSLYAYVKGGKHRIMNYYPRTTRHLLSTKLGAETVQVDKIILN